MGAETTLTGQFTTHNLICPHTRACTVFTEAKSYFRYTIFIDVQIHVNFYLHYMVCAPSDLSLNRQSEVQNGGAMSTIRFCKGTFKKLIATKPCLSNHWSSFKAEKSDYPLSKIHIIRVHFSQKSGSEKIETCFQSTARE